MHWNVFWGLHALFFAVFTFVLGYFLVFNRFRDDRNCTGHTKGRVIRYSSVRYNDINLPVVQYDVDGKQYEVVGPKFKGSRKVSKFAPISPVVSTVKTNVMTKEELPQVLDVYIEGNSFISVTKSPLIDLYPVGGAADVYYNPANPKHAYVQRPVEKSSWITIFFWGMIGIFLLVALAIFFGPEIRMTGASVFVLEKLLRL